MPYLAISLGLLLVTGCVALLAWAYPKGPQAGRFHPHRRT